ncbi:AMP-binding enzyme [Prescottella agglutinans]|uniref:AMP-binding enzyme n=1 Tax=Prescottella agglutinans TaxID=1644129 RepID=UPI0013E2D2D6
MYSLKFESAIAAHLDVARVAVFGRPDDLFGKRVCVALVPEPGVQPTEESLSTLAAQRLADYKVPVELVVPRREAVERQRQDLEAAAEPDNAHGGTMIRHASGRAEVSAGLWTRSRRRSPPRCLLPAPSYAPLACGTNPSTGPRPTTAGRDRRSVRRAHPWSACPAG